MEPTPYSPGQVVRLRSGGPKMVVEEITDGGKCRCVWIDDEGAPQSHDFAPATLEDGAPDAYGM